MHTMPTHQDTLGESNSPTALKGCGVKNHFDRPYINYIKGDIHCGSGGSAGRQKTGDETKKPPLYKGCLLFKVLAIK